MEIPLLKTTGYTAIIAAVFFPIMWILSATINGNWTFGVDTLSDMGASDNRLAAFFFNFGCIVTGACGVGAGYITYWCGKKTLRFGGMLFTMGMFFLSLVGVFTVPQPMHYIVSTAFGLLAGGGVIIASLSDRGVSWYFYVDVVLIVTAFIIMALTPFPFWEATTVICSLLWTLTLGIKMIKPERELFEDLMLKVN